MVNSEQLHLEKIASNSLYDTPINRETIKYSFYIFKRYFAEGGILEMGPAEGVMTELLAKTGRPLTLLEGSEIFCNSLKDRFPEAKVIHSLFEDFDTDVKYPNIILGHVLEHVSNPVEILQKAKRWLKPGTGRLLAAVPNNRSLHRQAAVIMGLLPQEDALNEMDIHHGHRRVFNPETFRNIFYQAGFKIEVFGGYWMKPVSNKQIEDNWTLEMIEAFMQLGERYPDIAAEIYVVASYAG